MNKEADISFVEDGESLEIVCSGSFSIENIKFLEDDLKNRVQKSFPKKIKFNLSKISWLDSAGAIFLIKTEEFFLSKECNVSLFGLGLEMEKFYNLCKEHTKSKEIAEKEKHNFISQIFYVVGVFVVYCLNIFTRFLSYTGEMILAIFENIKHPSRIRLNAINFHIRENGLKALPIIAITSLLIGVVIAFQGSTLLQKFGANIFIVDFVGIGTTRELAPLFVAIIIAGRSASAFTAQIGVMKITDEIDAMRTLGFSLWDFLILPRTYALIISLPLLVFLADAVSIFGAMVSAKMQLGIGYGEFLERFRESVAIKHIIIGLVKAPFFGCIIASIGCFRGFEIEGSTQNVGKYTTLSVVSAIFWVIAFDAIVSVFLTQMGL